MLIVLQDIEKCMVCQFLSQIHHHHKDDILTCYLILMHLKPFPLLDPTMYHIFDKLKSEILKLLLIKYKIIKNYITKNLLKIVIEFLKLVIILLFFILNKFVANY